MKIGNRDRWFELGDSNQVMGNKNEVTITGDSFEGTWKATITHTGISIIPDWIDENYSAEILQFIGEKIAPLILAGKHLNSEDLELCRYANLADKLSKYDSMLQDCVLTGTPLELKIDTVSAMLSPFSGVVTQVQKFKGSFGTEETIIDLMSKDAEFIGRLGPFLETHLNRGDSISKWDKLGTVTGNFTVMITPNGMKFTDMNTVRIISPLAFFGKQGIKLINESDLSGDLKEILVEVLMNQQSELKLFKPISLEEFNVHKQETPKEQEEIYYGNLVDPFEGY